MSDTETDGEYKWSYSGEDLQKQSWWKEGEPDSGGDCVNLSGDGGLQDDICENKKSEDGLIIRKPLCQLGRLFILKV